MDSSLLEQGHRHGAAVSRARLPTPGRFGSAWRRTGLILEAGATGELPPYAGRVSRARRIDLALASLCAVLSTASVAGDVLVGGPVAGARWWTVPLFLIPAVALLVRRTSPVLCVVGVWVPVAVHAVLTGHGAEGVFLVLPAWAALYALAAYGSRRQLVAGLGVAVAVARRARPLRPGRLASGWRRRHGRRRSGTCCSSCRR